MIEFSKIDFSKTSLLEVMIQIMSLIRDNFSKKIIYIELKEYIDHVKPLVLKENNINDKLKILVNFFYNQLNFRSADNKYKFSNTLWLDYVLKNKKGSSFSLGIIFLYISNKCNLPVYPVIFPTQLILKFYKNNNDQEIVFIDPFNGDFLNKYILDIWLKGNISPTAKLYHDDLKNSKPLMVIRKILDILKISLIEEHEMEHALCVSNFLLQLNSNDPYEIRDRGLICSQLGCNHTALKDLMYFVKNCPEDPISEIIKSQIYMIKKKKNILH